jgi:hypothetical protein
VVQVVRVQVVRVQVVCRSLVAMVAMATLQPASQLSTVAFQVEVAVVLKMTAGAGAVLRVVSAYGLGNGERYEICNH